MGQTLPKNKRKIKNNKNQKYESREEYFIRNGGFLLEKQIALSLGRQLVAGQLKIFSSEDMAKATKNYNPDLIVASSCLRTVHRGTLDGLVVTVKAPQQIEPHPDLFDHHLTEIAMSMVMNHANVVKLYGCCLETCIPILVHEFCNGSLFKHLHGNIASGNRMRWADCLRVATEAGHAVSYMHNALSKTVVHRHLNSEIILLDKSLHAKLSNFGFSVPITPDETPQKWPVEGIPGYIDPECIKTKVVTDKCDVYSFGVLLLELLTRKYPRTMATAGNDLVDVFISAVEKNRMMEIIDSEVLDQATTDEVHQVAQLALTCVAKKGDERPTMIEVTEQLWHIQRSRK